MVYSYEYSKTLYLHLMAEHVASIYLFIYLSKYILMFALF